MSANGNGRMKVGAGGHVLITGGAGFIGTNLASSLLAHGQHVVIYDNLSRPGVERNVQFLQARYPGLVDVCVGDVRDRPELRACLRDAEAVVHLAAQVAVTSSITNPQEDLHVNVLGSFSVLEELRALPRAVPLIFTSTNKVYGNLPDVSLARVGQRYLPEDVHLRDHGVDERRPLDFHSPYGCSKGAADQYILDYSRTFGLQTAVFRMSCIYGEHQCGNEDQGWVAHLAKCAIEGRPITIFGDGMQVRDVLLATDLVEAFRRALDDFARVRGQAFNIGGGPGNLLSLHDLITGLAARRLEPRISYADWRCGDQRWYVSNTSKFRDATGWQPRVSVEDGLDRLIDWLRIADRPGERIMVPNAKREVAQR